MLPQLDRSYNRVPFDSFGAPVSWNLRTTINGEDLPYEDTHLVNDFPSSLIGNSSYTFYSGKPIPICEPGLGWQKYPCPSRNLLAMFLFLTPNWFDSRPALRL